jgi:hypothetical protein
MDKAMIRNILLVSMMLTSAVLLAACGAAPAGPSAPEANGPTVDPNLVFTSGAQTVVAQITLDAASRPIPTAALPPTQTVNALPTLQPLGTPGSNEPPLLAAPGSTQAIQPGAAVNTTAALPTLAGLPSLTPAAGSNPVVAPVPDRMTWVKNVPADQSKVPAGKSFKITWTVQNTGTTSWTDTYSYKHFAGTQFAKSGGYPITKEVKPNSTTDLTVDAVAPTTPGEYYSLWVLQNADGVNFGRFDITLIVQ